MIHSSLRKRPSPAWQGAISSCFAKLPEQEAAELAGGAHGRDGGRVTKAKFLIGKWF